MAEKKRRPLYGAEREMQERKERLTDAEVAAEAAAEAAQQPDQRFQSPTKESNAADYDRRRQIEREAHEKYMRDNANPSEKFMVYEVPPVVVPPETLTKRAAQTEKYRRKAEEVIARAEVFRDQRATSGMTQPEMATFAGITLDALRDLEQGNGRGEEITQKAIVAYGIAARLAAAEVAAKRAEAGAAPVSSPERKPETAIEILATQRDWGTAEVKALAERLGLPENTIKSARKRLRETRRQFAADEAKQ